jgi:metallophosphoesterase superfamily enzyme
VSDLHTDYPENMEWVRRLPAQVGAGEGRGVDALVVAGDVAETRDNFARTMEVLRERFAAVFYVPGNHDLWLRREGGLYVSVHFLASPTFLDAFLSCAASKVFDEMPWHSYYGICCAV